MILSAIHHRQKRSVSNYLVLLILGIEHVLQRKRKEAAVAYFNINIVALLKVLTQQRNNGRQIRSVLRVTMREDLLLKSSNARRSTVDSLSAVDGT
jgi:hypothetical protein